MNRFLWSTLALLGVALFGAMAFVWLLRPRVPPTSPVDYGKPNLGQTAHDSPWKLYAQINKEFEDEFGFSYMGRRSKTLDEEMRLKLLSKLPELKEVIELTYTSPRHEAMGLVSSASTQIDTLCLEAAEVGDLETLQICFAVLSHHSFEPAKGLHLHYGKFSQMTAELVKSSGTEEQWELLSWMNQDTLVPRSRFRDVLLKDCENSLATLEQSYQFYGDSVGLKRLSQATPIIWNKYHRWIYLAEMGRCDELLIEEGRHWENHLHGRPLQNHLLKWQKQLYPVLTETHAVNIDLTPPTRNYFDTRLDWESARLNLALNIFESRHNRLPQTLQELVKEKLLPGLPLDPYYRKSIPRTRPLEYDGEKVWSVGWNGLEEKGTGDDLVIWNKAPTGGVAVELSIN